MSARAVCALGVVLALIVLVWPGLLLVQHHASQNSDAFVALYQHLMPAPTR